MPFIPLPDRCVVAVPTRTRTPAREGENERQLSGRCRTTRVHRAGTHFNLSSNALCDLTDNRNNRGYRVTSWFRIVVIKNAWQAPTPIANSTTADFPLDVPQFCGFHRFSLDASWHNNWFRCKLNTLHFKRSAQIKRACLWPHNERDFKLHRGSNP